MAADHSIGAEPFMLRSASGAAEANLPESALLSKRAASVATRTAKRVSRGLNDFADITVPGASFALAGPSGTLRDDCLPVRGDLAHIRLAGKVFVPHYVVPMAHVLGGAGAVLRRAGKADGEVMANLPAGTVFNLLDTSGGWAWGQVGDDGVVGYLPVEALKGAA